MGSRHLRFMTFLAPNMFPVYQFIADYVGKKLSYTTELIVGTSFDQFAAGEADAGTTCRTAGRACAARRTVRGQADLLLRCDRPFRQPFPKICRPAWVLMVVQRTRLALRLQCDLSPAGDDWRNARLFRQDSPGGVSPEVDPYGLRGRDRRLGHRLAGAGD
jgi:hypothetical protein